MTLVGWTDVSIPTATATTSFVTARPTTTRRTRTEGRRSHNQQRTESDPAKRKTLLIQASRIYVVDDPSRVWFQFGVSPILTVKAVTGMQSYATVSRASETAQLGK